MANRPIPVAEANSMMEEYVSYMQGLGAGNQSQYISFTAQELLNWLSDVMPFTDELRICEGIYPVGHSSAGRITVILWPYKDGNPATKPLTDGKDGGDNTVLKPYNDGTSGP